MPTFSIDLAVGLTWAVSAWLVGGLLTLPLENLIRPQGGGRKRPSAAWMIHFGLWTLTFGTLTLVSQRPVFAAGLGLAGALVVVLVNNAKYRALQEPFLFSDFGLFSQALRHPRLYLPFLGVGQALAGSTGVALSLYLGVVLEPALPDYTGWAVFLVLNTAWAATGILLLRQANRAPPSPKLEPERDLRELGLAASLWQYWQLERTRPLPPPPSETPITRFATSILGRRPIISDQLPHIVAVQSESFFDARRLLDGIKPQILSNFDRAIAGAEFYGRLHVPAWGANTMRTEFGFLTGISTDAMEVHRFNPYRGFARRPIPSLASLLRSLGYRTLCIHPHPMSFFNRDQVFPQLGFDEFIDIRHFDDKEKCGPYICDAAVTRMIGNIVAKSEQPLFIFAITMENHGPLHLEKVPPKEVENLYDTLPPAGFDDLNVYLRHLGNADAMLGGLIDLLSHHQRDGLLCWFGDHVPSMPQVYASSRYTDGRTDYLLWRNAGGAREHRNLRIEDLASVLLAAADLSPGN